MFNSKKIYDQEFTLKYSYRTRMIISILTGIVTILLSDFNINVKIGIEINFPWVIALPLIISIAYGPKFGVIAGISGAALYPFYLWPEDGYALIPLSLLFLSFYYLAGFFLHTKNTRTVIWYITNLGSLFGIIVLSFLLLYPISYNYLLSINPPFWYPKAITHHPLDVLYMFFLKDSVNFILMIFFAELLVKLPAFRLLIGLSSIPQMKNNNIIFTVALLVSLLMWSIILLLAETMIKNDPEVTQNYTNLFLYIILLAGAISARILIRVFEIRIDTEITLKESEEELRIAKEKAEESDRLKSAFLANMSHEIRTPMNGIIGFAQMLQTKISSKEKIKKYSDIIIQNSKRLMILVNDILDISKIESGKLNLIFKDLEINKLINELISFFNPQAIEKEITLKSTYSENDNYTINIDDTRLRQVLINLLNNAIKFTEKGEITVGYIKSNSEVKLFVKDTGIGIPDSEKENIFKRFRQVESEYAKIKGGTGLGLSISQKLVEHWGGTMWVESKENLGSTFYFTIPIRENDQS